MIIKNTEIADSAININIKRIINQTYKLLPIREQGGDWQKPLETIIEQLLGMSKLIPHSQVPFFSLLCKLQGLLTLTKEQDFGLYRRIIFECLSLTSELIIKCPD